MLPRVVGDVRHQQKCPVVGRETGNQQRRLSSLFLSQLVSAAEESL